VDLSRHPHQDRAVPLKLSIVYPCYLQQQTLLKHLARWQQWDSELLQNLDFIVVDDASRPPIEVPTVNLNFRLFRVTEDIIWNYGAKNLGVQKAHNQWVFLSELDHIMDENFANNLLYLADTAMSSRSNCFFMFKRSGLKAIPHPATYLFNTRHFWGLNGLDEDFCGAYGHDDTHLVQCLIRRGVEKIIPHMPDLECIMEDESYEDAELWRFKDVPRDTSRNDKMLNIKLNRKQTSRSRIRFDWELVHEYRFAG
jgi:hypothetical protein